MTLLPLAIFGSINWIELLVIVAAALMIFGSRLPEVALRGVAHVMRARRAVSKMWRETGLEEELRRVRRDIELNIPRDADFDVKSPPKPASLPVSDELDDDDSLDPDAERTDEPFDSSVTIEPAEGVIASGEWQPEEDVADSEADRREPIETPSDGDGADEDGSDDVPAEADTPDGDDPSKQAG